ncbi:Uncharacterised protein [Staphylococcus simiae]|nr:Uncharacterised protein [Staphylococcus simiae]
MNNREYRLTVILNNRIILQTIICNSFLYFYRTMFAFVFNVYRVLILTVINMNKNNYNGYLMMYKQEA